MEHPPLRLLLGGDEDLASILRELHFFVSDRSYHLLVLICRSRQVASAH